MVKFLVLIAILAVTAVQGLGEPDPTIQRKTCQERCYLKKEGGKEGGALNRWYFNRANGHCEPFIYGGSNGNRNRYSTELKCMQKCGDCPTQSQMEANLNGNQSHGALGWIWGGHTTTPLPTPTNLQTPTLEEVKYYVHFAGASYCKKSLPTWTCDECHRTGLRVELVKVINNEDTGNLGFIAVNPEKQEIIATFRGSDNLQNWVQNIEIWQIDTRFNDSVKLHQGFDEATKTIYPEVLKSLKDLHAKYPKYRIVLTGHSLGGAMASITLYYLTHDLPTPKYALFTYGQPRTGNIEFADWMNSQHIPAARAVHGRDKVPQLLELDFLGFEHHLIEFWDFAFRTRVCPKDVYEAPYCSISIPGILNNWADHITYFGTVMGGILCL